MGYLWRMGKVFCEPVITLNSVQLASFFFLFYTLRYSVIIYTHKLNLFSCSVAVWCGNAWISRTKKIKREIQTGWKRKENLEAFANSAFMNCHVNKNTVRNCQYAIHFPFSWFLQSRPSPRLFHFPTAIWYFAQAFEVGSRGRGSSQSLSMPLCDQ